MPGKNHYAGLLLIAVGLFLVLVLIPEGVVEPRKVRYAALSPSHYPRLIGIALTVLGAAVVLRAYLAPARVTDARADTDDRHPQAPRRICIFLLIMFAYAASVSWLGFILSSCLALTASLLLAGERRPRVFLPIAIATPVALHAFFLKVAKVPIPTGLLEPVLRGF